jgi:putative endonuclease
MPAWHLYMVKAADGSLYTGIATDVARRFAEHESGGPRCARYLRGRAPLQLVFKKRLGNRSLALKAEHRLRKLSKRQKEQIVRSNPGRKQLIARLTLEIGNRS